MKKILIFGLTSIVGGVETYIINLYSQLKNKYSFSFVIQEKLVGHYADFFKNENCNFYVVGNLKKTPLSTLKKLKEIYKNNNFDFAYLNMSNSSLFLYTLYLKKYNPNCQIISHSHNGEDKKKFQHFLIRPYLVRKTNVFITCSDIAGIWMFGKKTMNSKKVIQMNNAIQSDLFQFSMNFRKEIREKYNVQDTDFLVGHIGRFEKQKNHKFILEIAKIIQTRNKHIKFLLIGDGSLINEIKNEIKQNELNNIILTGIVKDTYKYYSAMDCFILPSLYEGLPIVGIEAQTNGLKCIFSSAITHQVGLSDNAIFIDLNTELWCFKLEQIISNYKLEDRTNGVLICKKNNFDLNTEINKIKEILK